MAPLNPSMDVSPDRVARLSATHPIELDPAIARRRLEAPDWLGTLVESPRSDRRRYLTDLAFPISAGTRTLLFRKAAYVDLGPVRTTMHGYAMEIEWSSASLAPLFPVFAGLVTINRLGLSLSGVYMPPLGGIGLLIDSTLLHFVARRTASWFLGRLAGELSAS
jgi:hypothetical protein